MKSALRSSICISISFVQALFVAILAILISLLIVLTSQFTVEKIEKSNFSDLAFAEMTEDLNDLSIPAGLPHDFFNDKLSKTDFKELLISKVNASIRNEDFTVNVEKIRSDIKRPVEQYIIDTLGTSEPVWDEALTQFENECTTTYLEYLSPTSFELIFSNFSKIFPIIKIATFVLSVIILGLFAFLYKLNSSENFFKFCFTIFAGAGLICSVLPLYLLITDEISRVGIGALSLYSFVKVFLTDFLWLFVNFGVLLIIISFIFLGVEIIISLRKQKAK